MFTRDIRLQPFSKMLKEVDSGPKRADLKGSDFAELRGHWNKTERDKFLEKLKSLTLENETRGQEILAMIDNEIRVTSEEGDKKELQKLQEFKKHVEESYAKLKTQYATEKARELNQMKIARERTVHGNESQANAVLMLLKSTGANIPTGLQENLKHVNIASISRLLAMPPATLAGLKEEFGSTSGDGEVVADNGTLGRKGAIMLKEAGYTADGSLGSQEVRGVYNFLNFFLNANEAQKKLLLQISDYASKGLDASVLLRHTKVKTSPEKGKEAEYVVARLTDTYEGSRISRSELAKHLTAYLKSPDNVSTLGKFLGMDGGVEALAQGLQKSPELIAKFYDQVQLGILFAQTYNQSANFDMYYLDRILKGTYASINEKVGKNESIETQINDKIKAAITAARGSLSSSDTFPGVKREEFLKKLDALEANPAALEGAKSQIMRLAGVGAMANIGKGANLLGAGASFETAIKDLTFSVGAFLGEGGKLGLGLVARYGLVSGKITETKDSTITGRAGINAGIPAFIALDAGFTMTDKIKTFGGGGFEDVKSNDFNTVLGKGFATITYSRLDRREDTIREYGRRIESALSRIAFDGSDRTLAVKIESALTSEGLESKNSAQLARVTSQIEALFASENDPLSRLLLLRNMGENQTRMLLADEVANSVDGKSFGGWSLGLGHLLGVTFPVAGISFYEVEQYYQDLAAKNAKAKKESYDVPSVTPGVPDTYTTKFDADIAMIVAEDLQLEGVGKKTIELILLSRGIENFKEFQLLLAGDKEGEPENRKKALRALETHLNDVIAGKFTVIVNYSKLNLRVYSAEATALLNQLKKKGNVDKDFALLSGVNALSSGSYDSRALGDKIGTPEYGKVLSKAKNLKAFLDLRIGIAKGAWGNTMFDALYTKEKFATFASRSSAPKTNFIGMVDYEQLQGNATKFDTMTSGFPLVGITPVEPEHRETTIDKLLAEFKTSRPQAYEDLKKSVSSQLKQIGSNVSVDTAIIQLLKGGEIQGVKLGDKEQKITSKGAKVFKGLSAVPGATCFNSAAYMELPKIDIEHVEVKPGKQPEKTTKTFEFDVPAPSGTRSDIYNSIYYNFGVSGYSPKPGEPLRTETTPGVDPRSETTPGHTIDVTVPGQAATGGAGSTVTNAPIGVGGAAPGRPPGTVPNTPGVPAGTPGVPAGGPAPALPNGPVVAEAAVGPIASGSRIWLGGSETLNPGVQPEIGHMPPSKDMPSEPQTFPPIL